MDLLATAFAAVLNFARDGQNGIPQRLIDGRIAIEHTGNRSFGTSDLLCYFTYCHCLRLRWIGCVWSCWDKTYHAL